jgi:hypothetical protein
MFVRDFIEVHQPFEAVAPRLVRDAVWLEPIAHDALEEAIATLGALGPHRSVDLGLPPVTVRCARGPVRLRSDVLVMALRWETNLPAWMPFSLDGDLEVVPLGVERSHLALNANTLASPPVNDAVTRRVAETGVRAFLRQLASSLEPVS